MCIAVNPYIPGEAMVVTETGGTYLWRCDRGLTTMCPAEQCDSAGYSPWYQCVFAANPRCIAMANGKSVDLLDFRVSFLRMVLTFVFVLHSAYLVVEDGAKRKTGKNSEEGEMIGRKAGGGGGRERAC